MRVRIDYPRSDFDGWRRYVPSWRQWLALAGGFFGLLIVLFAIAYATVDIPNPNKLAEAQNSVFTYADGKTELGRDGAQNREVVPLERIPMDVRHAVLSAEDRNFYSEPGISPTGIARAMWVNVRGGEISQGGSTITQQYAKNAYLTQDRTFTRKFKEIFISLKLDRERSKDEILRDYLNTVYFGRGAYGVQTAAQAYFNRDVDQLNLSQSATLAAVLRAPALFDPVNHPDAAEARWHYVLDGMVDEGWVDGAAAQKAQFPPRNLRQAAASSALAGPKGYIIKAAEAEMAAHGISEDQLNLGQLTVQTTIERQAQTAAVDAMEQLAPSSTPKDLRSALVSVEPGTGKILAMYGGRNYQKRPFDNALQGRAQAGSSFKPFVLATALNHGISLDKRYSGGSPQTISGQKVSNFGDEQFGTIDLVEATAHSVNTVYYQLGIDAGGPDDVARTAEDAGIRDDLEAEAEQAGGSLFLGGFGDGIRPVDQADAYATFAAEGVHAPPYLVQKVTDRHGHTLYEANKDTDRAFDEDVMADTTYALQAVVRRGTATGAQLAGGRPAAGKTGTTSGNTAAWFVGYTPQMSTAVTLFRDNNKPLVNIAGIPEVTGGTIPARLWKAYMDAALVGKPIEQFPQASGRSGSPGTTASATATPTGKPTGKPTVTVTPSASASPTQSATPSPTKVPKPTIKPSKSPPASPPDNEPSPDG